MKSAYDVLLSPIVTEQSMDQMQENRYAFRVDPRANKAEIREAVETAFEGVKVARVNTMNMRGKKTRVGSKMGKKPDWKKAIVTLAADSKNIEFFEGL